jgi:hypothetical protein
MTETTNQLWTVNTIKEANRAAGGHWFDPDTMRSFGTKVLPTVYQGPGGVYFVTRDRKGFREEDGYGYTVRRFDYATGSVESVKGVNVSVGALTKRQAVAMASNRASAGEVLPGNRGTVQTTEEAYRPVSVLQQFIDDLKAHGDPATATADNAEQLIILSRKHHKLMEADCNGTVQLYDEEGNDKPRLRKLREHIALIAMHVGATAVDFSGDPRGCTVKLTFADGATNDFGGEGWCVPTETK